MAGNDMFLSAGASAPPEVTVERVDAPAILSVRFGSSGAQILVTFDRPTNFGRVSATGSTSCSDVITNIYEPGGTALTDLGGVSLCSWKSDTELELQLARYTACTPRCMVQPADTIVFRNVITLFENSHIVDADMHTILAPTVKPLPLMVVKASGLISQCVCTPLPHGCVAV